MKQLPIAFLNILERAYAADPDKTEADLMWLAGEYNRGYWKWDSKLHINGTTFADLLSELKSSHARNPRTDKSVSVPPSR